MAFRILSLDGGGAWALLQVKALIEIYGRTAKGHDVLRDFDLAAANSGGSIVLGGLVEDLPLRTLLDYFEDRRNREAIFSPTSNILFNIAGALSDVAPRYSADRKLPALAALFRQRGGLPLSEAAKGIRRAGAEADLHLLIVGFDYDRERARFFRSAKPKESAALGQGAAARTSLVEAIHASTNAPIKYFDGPAVLVSGQRFWDGGITGCNNPVLAAVTEAVTLHHSATDIVALSIGTGTVALPSPTEKDEATSPYVHQRSDTGLIKDVQKLAFSILGDPPDIASFVAHVMTGYDEKLPDGLKSRIVRMNPLVSPIGSAGAWGPPEGLSRERFIQLRDLDMDAVKPEQVTAIAEFGDLWIKGKVLNQPIRMDGDTLQLEIGQKYFDDARNAWRALMRL